MKKLIAILMFIGIIVTLCGCDTGHNIRTTSWSDDNCRTIEAREYKTDANGQITEDSGTVLVTFETEEEALRWQEAFMHKGF